PQISRSFIRRSMSAGSGSQNWTVALFALTRVATMGQLSSRPARNLPVAHLKRQTSIRFPPVIHEFSRNSGKLLILFKNSKELVTTAEKEHDQCEQEYGKYHCAASSYQ